MRLNSPSFWYPNTPNGKSCRMSELVFSPFALLYQLLHKLNYAAHKPYKAEMPVICIGNINIGGSGKTPTAIAVMDILKSKKLAKNPYFLSRGYGGLVNMPTVIDPDIHDHVDVGDEAMVLYKHAPIITAKKRKAGAKFAATENCDCLVMDDGLQNNSLEKTLTFCVIDGVSGFGNGKTFPAGPLRETPDDGFRKSDAFIFIGDDTQHIAAKIPADKPVFKAQIETAIALDQKQPYIAFAGIGRPEKFKATLDDQKLDIRAFHPFPDHHNFSKNDLEKLVKGAHENKAILLTTEKDLARLPAAFIQEHNVQSLPIMLKWENQKSIEAFLKSRLKDYNQAV